MKVYFGGVDRPGVINQITKGGGRHALVSFGVPPSPGCWRRFKELGVEVLADSGAFTFWRKSVTARLEDYIEWIVKWGPDQYINLDVIGSPEETARNQLLMEGAGLHPIPVFHFGDDFEFLKGMVGKYQIICLGGTVPIGLKNKLAWFTNIFTLYPNQRFHGLGVSRNELLNLPFYSVDSVWWLFRFKTKVRRLAPEGSRIDERVSRVRWLVEYEIA